jgi:hypothetical protein
MKPKGILQKSNICKRNILMHQLMTGSPRHILTLEEDSLILINLVKRIKGLSHQMKKLNKLSETDRKKIMQKL